MSMENKEEGAQVKASPQEAHVITNNNSFQLTKCRDETQIVADAVRSSHSDAVRDLLSIGVCARCIFRLFGVDQRVYSCSFLSPAIFGSLIEAPRGSHECMVKEGFKENEGLEKRELVQEAEIEPSYCCICLGILQFSYREEKTALVKRGCVSEFTTTIAELVKQEGHELDSFSLEISTPAVIVANERSTRLYMKKKYGSELWFQEKFLTKLLSVKDALTLSITNSLETLLGVKVGIGSFVIRLSYTHTKVRLELPNLLGRDQGCKKKKTGML
ncbi:hypothetical protein GIB67_007064 [Kingdonia uniflora]|uniref:Pus10 N-terminal eukaryotes domain-containing protein n=1 Tax=Kingdonia uniflora TaxID=39325 RepID=A0A7J7NZD6_9MAGN|nr:hypothetical protein GIB67_007064 [Kingdonia uniflora]